MGVGAGKRAAGGARAGGEAVGLEHAGLQVRVGLANGRVVTCETVASKVRLQQFFAVQGDISIDMTGWQCTAEARAQQTTEILSSVRRSIIDYF